jgi:uncharacterized membrane protein YsdA (DUF1294 family)
MPAARQRWRSSSSTEAVSAMMGGAAAPWVAMISREAAKPSISGMLASIRMAA